MKPGLLYSLSIRNIPAKHESTISSLLEGIFGRSAVVFADFETGMSQATIYSKRRKEFAGLSITVLHSELNALLPDHSQRSKTCILKIGRLPPENWAESWKHHFRPIRVGAVLIVKPSWSRVKRSAGQRIVVLDPGLSFGTGHHPTTLFCLRQISRLRPHGENRSLLDVGTGSGILAISAAKLGYRSIVAVDNDLQAVKVARANASRNRCASRLSISRADLMELPIHSKRTFDVVCANLTDDLLVTGAPRLLRRTTPGGTLILAGILSSRFADVQACYDSRGLRLSQRKDEKEWSSGAFIRSN